MLEVLQTAFRRWPYAEIDIPPIDHLRWKLSDDAAARSLTWVVEDGGRVVGTNIVNLVPARLVDRTLVRCTTFDSALLPEYQGAGIYTALRDAQAQERRRSSDFEMSVPESEAILRVRANEGWRPVANCLEALWLPARIPAALRRRRPRELVSAGAQVATSLVRRAGAGARRAPRDVRIAPDRAFDARYDRLWDAAAADFAFIADRSAAQLARRYGDRRAGPFVTLSASDPSGELLGYCVYRRSHGDGYIADLLVRPGRLDACEALVRRAVARLRVAGVARVDAWLPRRHPYRRVLTRRGFVRARSLALGWVPWGASREDLAVLDDRSAGIHFTMGDVDLV